MDKKNIFIGTLLVLAAFTVLYFNQRLTPQHSTPAEVRRAVTEQQGSSTSLAAQDLAPAGSQSEFVSAQPEHAGANLTSLENDYIRVRFTDFGGAIRDVALKKYPAGLGRNDPFIFNELHADPLLGFSHLPGLDRGTRFALVSSSSDEVVYRAVLDGRVEVTRHYRLSPNSGATTDPYELRQETTFRNLSDKPTTPMTVAIDLGTVAPTDATDFGLYLSTGASNGSSQTFTSRASLQSSSGLAGIGAHDAKPTVTTPGPVVWATVKSQFFASIFTPDDPGSALVTRRVKLLGELPDADPKAYGVTAVAEFVVNGLPAHGESKIGADLYVGPKEYKRLSNSDVFRRDQDRIMDFGWFRFFSATLLTLMTWIHSWTANWGVAIIVTTLVLKSVFLPLTLSASRSAKRMQKLQPELKVLREKFKDNPQKQQAAQMELFKRHKVNPVGGCLPVIITLPFFWGFYRMLPNAAELRFAPFLWARDLSAPDTVLSIGHGTLPLVGTFHLNILPLLLAATVFIQMQITPQPTVDNAQARMMKFMPIMFMFFYYGYSCALSLYSTMNALFTIGQQVVINRMKDLPEAPAAAAPASGGKKLKNVTPRKR